MAFNSLATLDKQSESIVTDGEKYNKISQIESIVAGLGSGLIQIPKGLFSLGASLMDLGAGTNKAAQVEKYFDDVRFLGDNGIEVGNEIKDAMLDAYNNQNSSSSQQGGQTWGSKANNNQQRAESAQANTQAMSKPANKNKGKRRALWDDA